MRSVDISDATRSLADDAREAIGEPLVVTRRGKPVAAVVPVEGMDLESLALATHPDFIALIERSRASERAGGGLTLEEMRRKYGLEKKPSRRSRRVSARPRRANAGSRSSRTRPSTR